MLVVRKPSRETGLGRKSFVPCDRRGSGLHISETRRRAENPLAAKKQFVRYSHPIVSQNQTKSGGAKNTVCSSNRKKSKCHLSRSVTDSYVDMRIRQPDISNGEYLARCLHRPARENLVDPKKWRRLITEDSDLFLLLQLQNHRWRAISVLDPGIPDWDTLGHHFNPISRLQHRFDRQFLSGRHGRELNEKTCRSSLTRSAPCFPLRTKHRNRLAALRFLHPGCFRHHQQPKSERLFRHSASLQPRP